MGFSWDDEDKQGGKGFSWSSEDGAKPQPTPAVTQLEKNAPKNGTMASVAREGALGLASGLTPLAETQHPVMDAVKNLGAPMAPRSIWEKLDPTGGALSGVVKTIGSQGSQLMQGIRQHDPEAIAHSVGQFAGEVAPMVVSGKMPEVSTTTPEDWAPRTVSAKQRLKGFIGDTMRNAEGKPHPVSVLGTNIPSGILDRMIPARSEPIPNMPHGIFGPAGINEFDIDKANLPDYVTPQGPTRINDTPGQLMSEGNQEVYTPQGPTRINPVETAEEPKPVFSKISEGPTATQHAAVRSGQRAVATKNARQFIPRVESPNTPGIFSNEQPDPDAIIKTPEEWKARDQRQSIFEREASDAGMQSAARGKVGKKLNYQQRLGRDFRNR